MKKKIKIHEEIRQGTGCKPAPAGEFGGAGRRFEGARNVLDRQGGLNIRWRHQSNNRPQNWINEIPNIE